MILSICTADKTIRIELSADQFLQLRNPESTSDQIAMIAEQCQIAPDLLIQYVSDIQRSSDEYAELDTACDYTDQL